jgi:hypothetical protein
MYDNGNDQWLEMDGYPGEWVVAFHGVRTPRSFCQAKTENNKNN